MAGAKAKLVKVKVVMARASNGRFISMKGQGQEEQTPVCTYSWRPIVERWSK